MNIVFRVDAYPEVGLGHFVRCLSIASELKQNSQFKVSFAGNFSENSQVSLRDQNFSFVLLNKEEDENTFIRKVIYDASPHLIFIDNLYAYDKNFIVEIKQTAKIICFHNICEGSFYADAFILPSAHHPEGIINDDRWEENKVDFYYGFKYVPINDSVIKYRNRKVPFRDIPEITITTGGSDPEGVMLKLLEYINKAKLLKIKFKALIGESFMKRSELENLLPELSDNILVDIFSYDQLANSNLVISTFGVTSYELIYMGIPFMSISHAEKNAQGSKLLSERFPFIIDLGHFNIMDQGTLIEALNNTIYDKELQESFSTKCMKLVDDKGIDRIIAVIQLQLQNN